MSFLFTPRARSARERPRSRRLAAPAAVTLALALALAGCSDSEEKPDAEPSSSATGSATPSPEPTFRSKVSVMKVTGKLPKKRRAAVRARLGGQLHSWFEKAYLGDYPRTPKSFNASFADFTPRAKKKAQVRRKLLTNAEIAGRIDSLTPVRGRIDLDIMAVNRRAKGVTARVRLIFDTEGEVTGRHVVGGHLSLIPVKGHWRVFAFDIGERRKPLPRASKPSGSPSPSSSGTPTPEETDAAGDAAGEEQR